MAEKKKYNSILVSGRKDQTLTYSKYVKDEESGESVKESLDKKVNVTDELTTQQIKDGAITNEKMAADSVGNTNLQDGSVSNEKLEDGSITNEKLAENSITKDKLQDKTIGVEKLDNELRQTIAAATGLPEDLVETIQNVDDTLKDHQSQLDDKQSQIDDKQQQITANDEDISLLQTRSTQMEETIKSIAATGGASQATAVTYNNEKSKLTAVNIQSAVDEVVDKTAIKDEEGTVVETPFRYIQNEEFIFAKVDAEDRLLFGIQWDGTPVFGKTSAVEDRLQSQVTLLAERVATIMGDEDTTNVIDTMNELKKFFAEIENTETLTGILANLNSLNTKFGEDIKNLQDTKVDKEEGKSLIDDEVKECFKVIQNEEFIHAVVDAEDKFLFGIYRDTGKPYFPLNEMYHVEQNEEFFAAWLDTDDKVLLGIRRDGQIIGEIHAVDALKQAISQIQSDLATLQEKVGAIDTNLKELLDVFSLQKNPEYMAVETDAGGRILSYRESNGTKHENIGEEVKKIHVKTSSILEGETTILGSVKLNSSSRNSIIESISSEYNFMNWSSESKLELPEPECAKINLMIESLPKQDNDIISGNLEYYDKKGNYFNKPIEVGIQGQTSRIYARSGGKANYSVDITDGSTIKFGDWVPQDSFHLKGSAKDFTKCHLIPSYKIIESIIKSLDARPYRLCKVDNKISSTNGSGSFNTDYESNILCHPDGFPIELYYNNEYLGLYTLNLKKHRDNYGMSKKDYNTVLIDPDQYIDPSTFKGGFWTGRIWWYIIEIRNPKTLICYDGSKYDGDNPKELIDSTSSAWDGSKDQINTQITKQVIKEWPVKYQKVLDAMYEESADGVYKKSNGAYIKWEEGDKGIRYNIKKDLSSAKALLNDYFDVEAMIALFIGNCLLGNTDSIIKNTLWGVYNNGKIAPFFYDLDGSYGTGWIGNTQASSPGDNTYQKYISADWPLMLLSKLYSEELKTKYALLREEGVVSESHINKIIDDWTSRIGSEKYSRDLKKWSETPSYRESTIVNEEYYTDTKGWTPPSTASIKEYNENTTFNVGDYVYIYLDNNKGAYTTSKWYFYCKKENTGILPVNKLYNNFPCVGGWFDSPKRIKKWIKEQISILDNIFNYSSI